MGDLLSCGCENKECTTHTGRCNRAAHWSQRVYGELEFCCNECAEFNRDRLPKGYITEDVPIL